ncbi:E3 ubiquitin-protein ligase RNF26-like [Brachyistius frenatus]|uniref:E3 ubiquitin-protein ligase RNF26-like n=1 Tax=Brachyistius frenatus TaxID=100188 RepID=UPI0037E8C81D
MEEVNVVLQAAARCADACCLLLELLVTTLGWLLYFLSAAVASLGAAAVTLSDSAAVDYWNGAVFSFLRAAEAASGVLESFKMVGHLSCHVVWRVKDALQRGLASGGGVLRQVCEGVFVALSLVLYVANTAVNVLLIGAQNCASALAGVWQAAAAPVQRVVELALTLLTFLYSCVVGVSVLLWTPCRLLLDALAALGHVFATVDARCLLAAAILLALLLLNPGLPVLFGHLGFRLVNALPGDRPVQGAVRRLRAVMAADQVVRSRAEREAEREAGRTRLSETSAGEVEQQSRADAHRDDGPEDGELLSLLKEQEERKKCVVCQDRIKTVLLLPCRHLCLCPPCADILRRRSAALQRCCPLCRQNITQTMDVFL